jgi:transcriptional regulator with PAS, ATPase and Fis domain
VIFTFRRRIVQLEKSKTLTPRLLQTLYPLKKIQLPPLRERRDDIPLLAREYALKIYRHHQDRGGAYIRGIAMDGTLDEELEQLLRIHRWEGNVRDLIAFVRSLAMFPFREELLEREKLELFRMVGMIEAGEEFSLPSGLAGVERALVDRAVHTSNRNSTGVAKLLGISERALGRRISGVRRS